MRNRGVQQPPNTAAHHIVPETDKRATIARNILNKYGLLNKAENGVFLPTSNNRANTPGIQHNGRHNHKYIDAVNSKIQQADNIGGKNAVITELDKIRNTLSSASRSASWETVL